MVVLSPRRLRLVSFLQYLQNKLVRFLRPLDLSLKDKYLSLSS